MAFESFLLRASRGVALTTVAAALAASVAACAQGTTGEEPGGPEDPAGDPAPTGAEGDIDASTSLPLGDARAAGDTSTTHDASGDDATTRDSASPAVDGAPDTSTPTPDAATRDAATPDAATPPDAGGCVPVGGGTCGLAPQCGCAANATCAVTTLAGGVACVAAGTVPQGRGCSASSACAPGLGCIWGACRPYCTTVGAQCTGAGLGVCDQAVTSTGTPIPNMKACAVDCQLASATSCGGAPTGCVHIPNYGVDCITVGTKVQGASCGDDTECAPGHKCDLGTCAKWCRLPTTTYPSDCAGTGGSCLSVNVTVEGVRYGTCF